MTLGSFIVLADRGELPQVVNACAQVQEEEKKKNNKKRGFFFNARLRDYDFSRYRKFCLCVVFQGFLCMAISVSAMSDNFLALYLLSDSLLSNVFCSAVAMELS